MPSILQHQSTNATKLMLIGDSGTGKTGALCSLVTAGYKLRILDFDNGLDIIRNMLTDPNSVYAAAVKAQKIDLDEAVRFVTFTEHTRNVNGAVMPKSATVWTRTMNQLEHWKEKLDDGTEFSLGKPRDWDRMCVLVLDSLTMLSQGALNFIQSMNGRLGTTKMGYDTQRDIGETQLLIERMLMLLYDDAFNPNVVVISHIVYRNSESFGTDKKDSDGKAVIDPFGRKGFPSSIGVALSPRIPRYFNNVLQVETEGMGASTKHKLYTVPQAQIGLKSSAPIRVATSYPISTGLADFFKAVRG